MSTPLSSIQGLSSNIQWQDLITQIIAQDTARQLTPVTTASAAATKSATAWTNYQNLVKKLKDAAGAVRDGSIGGVKASGGATSSGRSLITAAPSTGAAPGTYRAEVLSLARAAKIGGASFSSSSAARSLDGEFFVNGARVAVSSTDSLAKIRDTVNALNNGTNATGVSAAIESTTGGGYRLVLTSSVTGANGIELADGASEILQQLGLTDGTTSAPTTATASTYRFASTSTAIATALGASDVPAATSIQVGNQTVSTDLSTDTLADIKQRLLDAGINASIASESFNGATRYRLNIAENVSAVSGNADSARVMELLGLSRPSQSSVTQVLKNTSAWTDASDTAVTSATALSDLKVGGTALSLAAGDVIQINGTRGDGVAVSSTMTLDGTETVSSLLAKLSGSSLFGNSTRPASVSLDATGNLVVTDGTAGASQLSLSLSVKRAAGGTSSLGFMGVNTAGYDRVLTAGSDAQLLLDGSLITRSSNTISDAIPDVTLNLAAAEPGTEVDVTLSRDTDAATAAAQSLVTAFNAITDFVKKETAANGSLPFDVSLRASLRTLSLGFQQNVTGVTGTYTRAAQVGLAIDKFGHLALDTAAFANALATNPADVMTLFAKNGTVGGLGGTIADLADTISKDGGVAWEHSTALQRQAASLDKRADTIQTLLDRRKDTLTAQYTAMEAALAKLQAQGATISAAIKSLQSSGN